MMDRKRREDETARTTAGPEAEAGDEHPHSIDPESVAEAADDSDAVAQAEDAAAGESEAETIARLEAEKADLTERLLRLAADMDNLRKRSERDVADAGRYAMARFAADMLTIADNLRRALDAVPGELREAGDVGVAALIEGVEMTAREFDRLMARHGVERIDAEGQRFDPHRHQAMFEVPDPNVAPGTIVQVVQDGYTIGDRVLRAAMVGVAKAAPGQPAEAGASEGEDEAAEGEPSSRAAQSG
ncbi:MAG TPA: nucleotide exchange factor GrpE [Afifellaceae bacterium]|nr:nucleotide exchange factor GrpE [Afifellaceae bacterium]